MIHIQTSDLVHILSKQLEIVPRTEVTKKAYWLNSHDSELRKNIRVLCDTVEQTKIRPATTSIQVPFVTQINPYDRFCQNRSISAATGTSYISQQK